MSERRIIEGTWTCSSCDTSGIPARERKCPNCMSVREDDETAFDFGDVDEKSGASLKESVTDEAALAKAEAGADWLCPYCNGTNQGDHESCTNCGSAVDPANRRYETKTYAAPKDAPPPPPAPAEAPKKGPSPILIGLGVVVVGVVGFVIWANQTREASAVVDSLAWNHTITVETFTKIQQEGWQSELSESASVMPTDGKGEKAGVENIRACTRKQKGTKKVAAGEEEVCRQKTRQVQCGTEKKCERKDMGNGFMEEVCEDIPKYCDEQYEDCQTETKYVDEPVYGEWCTYDTWEWQTGRVEVAEGHDAFPSWPKVEAGKLDRLDRQAKYSVALTWDDGSDTGADTLNPKTEAEFKGWRVGKKLAVKVNNLGNIDEIVPEGGK